MEDRSRTTQTLKEHHAIYEAIAAGNAERAQELMTKHIANAKEHMLKGEY